MAWLDWNSSDYFGYDASHIGVIFICVGQDLPQRSKGRHKGGYATNFPKEENQMLVLGWTIEESQHNPNDESS